MQKNGPSCKKEAVALAQEIGVQAAAQRLGISTKTLYGWRRASTVAIAAAQSPDACARRIRELEQEVSELQHANGILKKAMGFLAR